MSEKTAYEQSVAVGYALLNQLSAEQAEQEKAAEIQRLHKRAFRVAYDMLMELYPIGKEPDDYWKFATERVALIYSENKDNRLCELLMMAVWEYVEGVWKGRNEHEQSA